MYLLYLVTDWLNRVYNDLFSNRRITFYVNISVSKNGYDIGGNRSSLGELEDLISSNRCYLPIMVELAKDRYIKRPLSTGVVPFGRAVTLARLDAEEHVPFLQNETYFMFSEGAVGVGTDYYIVRKDIVDPLLGALARSRCSKVIIRLKSDEGDIALSRASLRSIIPLTRGEKFRYRCLCVAFVMLSVFTVATFTHVYLRNATAAGQLNELVELKQNQASAVRRKLEKRQQELQLLQAARAAKAEAIPISVLWEDLTRILPDATWLTDLSVRNEQVVIAGFSGSAAGLIAILGKSSYLTEPSFTSPVVRVPGQQGERFSIQMRMKNK